MSAKRKLKLETTETNDSGTSHKERSEGFNRRGIPKLLIYPRFQLLLIGSNVAILIVAFAGFWIASQQIIQGLLPAATLSGVEVEFFQRYLTYQEQQFHTAYLGFVIVALVLSAGVTLLLSHRVAGPMVRLRHFLRAIINHKKPAPLTFRDGDFLSDLPGLVNDAVDTLRKEHR